MILLPDILDSEKSEIREIAKYFALNLWKISFSDGLRAYVKSSNNLHIHPARWKYCLKCGEIKKKENMDKHSCLMDVEEVPILLQSSWYKLKEFFLSDKYKAVLKEIGGDKLPKPAVIVETKDIKTEDRVPEPVSEKELS